MADQASKTTTEQVEPKSPISKTLGPRQYYNGAIRVDKARTTLQQQKDYKDHLRKLKEAEQKYGRGRKINVKKVKDKKLLRNLETLERKAQIAVLRAKDVEILNEETPGFLEPEHELERTWKVKQDQIVKNVAISTAQKRFDLKLTELGPYLCEYTRNGRELLLAGQKGHVAALDWRSGKLMCEIQLRETIRDIRWLHQNQFFAVAQKDNVFIYDTDGLEIHRLERHTHVTHMEFLPYHFLLTTFSSRGHIRYQDTSTGQMVTELITKQGAPASVAQNPYNAIMHVGHQEGAVTLWSPNAGLPLVKLLAHRGPVRSIAVDREGRYMVTGGQDQKMCVWDLRMFKEVADYRTRKPLTSIAISDTGLTATAWGTKSTIWRGLFQKDRSEQEHVSSPYMEWGGEGKLISRLRWCPYDDVLGYGHDEGFSSIIVPGAGEANFDAFEANPFETNKQRREGEVKALLNKLKPEMITLDPNFIGNIDVRTHEQRVADKDLDGKPVDEVEKLRNRAKGRNSAAKRYVRKQQKRNIVDEKKLKVEAAWQKILAEKEGKKERALDDLGPALARFSATE